MANWRIKKQAGNLELMCQTLEISETTAQVLLNRGIRSKNSAIRFLNPELSFLQNTFLMKDLEKAFNIIKDCLQKQQKVAIYGDYDVDGVTSTVILYKLLKRFGADVTYYIPHREEEGYGLNLGAVSRLFEDGVNLIICCDNGISAFDEIQKIKNLGMQVIVIDHHEPGFLLDEDGNKIDVIPPANAIINAKQKNCSYPFKMLCTGGLMYKIARAYHEFINEPMSIQEEHEYLVFAMIATFCDIVDLQDENRIIAKSGLKILNDNKKINLGLYELLRKKNYEDKTIDAFSIGFIVGPCINACGRLESARISVELFLEQDILKAQTLAEKLAQLNDERKEITASSVEKVVSSLKENEQIDKVVVVFDENIHESVAGIVAGRIKEALYRPVIVLTRSGDLIKGSARSIEKYDIFEELYKCKHLFEKFGGHKMAAGVSLREDNIGELKKILNENCVLNSEDFVEVINIDKQLDLSCVTYELASELQLLQPFGKENREPLFGTLGVIPEQLRVIPDKNTMIFTFLCGKTNRRLKGICFGQVEDFKTKLLELYDEYTTEKILAGVLRETNLTMDIVYYIDINEYNGNVSVQLKIKDYRLIGR